MDNNGSKNKTRVKALRLQHLPPDILSDVLSRLEFKEAARMSILSRKWRRLWRCYENLVFTRETMFSSGSNAVRNRHKAVPVVLLLDHCASCFTNLKKLKLDGVSVPGHLQCLLPECAVLEWLSIVRCTLHGLQTSQPLYRLRYLRVQHCEGMRKVEIQVPNFDVFKFHDSPMAIVLNGCLALAEATVALLASSDCFNHAFTVLPSGIPHARKLNMELIMCGNTKMQEFTKCPTVFFNLKHLVLTMEMFRHHDEHTGGIIRLAYLLELAPVLEELELHLEWHGTGQFILWDLRTYCPRAPEATQSSEGASDHWSVQLQESV
ncbi:unnamed protein product [Miscanthus lutarioriparius]|uniref:F-box domain-containing protein n=1 Tax=Miscanthus lutarioriparius TaxID=422564 RepID=A0A811QSG3_9POAL|nr:unnamed protein product [Miscanthus lutarioriparius]